MIKYVILWLFMGIFVTGYAQTITVKDLQTGKPLESATISSRSFDKVVVTNKDGQADISAFKNDDSIYIRIVGYQTLSTDYAELKKSDFTVSLVRSVTSLKEVIVSEARDSNRLSSLHIEPLYIKDIEKEGAFSMTDALSKIAGISQLSTGVGISKPVIRGVYGDRVQVLFSGLRFDNHQWQDEHGLGLSNTGISRIDIIKGPLSLLYGTGAVGGVINILEEEPPKKGTSETDFQIEAHSNTGGGTVQAGTKANYGKNWYRIRLAATNHADYTDGNGDRVLNSRFNGYYLKSSYGFTKGNWCSENHYHFSYNNYGFIFGNLSHFMEIDNRWSRSMSGPHHIVMLNVLSSLNEFKLKKSRLKVDVGLQSNMRSEDEGGGELSLQMHLATGQYSLKWFKHLKDNLLLVLTNSSIVGNNANYGKRKIVPDAWTGESFISGYLKHQIQRFIFEYGVGGGGRYIKTLLTPTVNSAEKDIAPFEQTRPFINGMAGASFFPGKAWNLKAHLATGVRAPNLAELSSNGLHEGVYTYEIGDPDMDNEQNINGDLSLYYSGKLFQISVSGFYNYFNGYIYLEPTDEEWFGFPIFRYRQHDARIYGGESVVSVTPSYIKGLKISASYAGLIGELDNGDYLPYMPAQKMTPEIHYSYVKNENRSAYLFINNDFVLAQNLVNPEEKPTPSYSVLNAGIGVIFKSNSVHYNINVSGNNLLNEAYYDHLSRFKNFGLLNIGRDISVHLKINFINNIKTTKK